MRLLLPLFVADDDADGEGEEVEEPADMQRYLWRISWLICCGVLATTQTRTSLQSWRQAQIE